MRALHVITGLGVGGAEQQLRLLLRHLPVECDVVTLTNPGPVAEGLRADGVSVHHLGMAGNRDLRALPRLTALIRHGRYDLVHTHLYRAGVYGRLAARLAGVRAAVATEHSLGEAEIEGRPLTGATRALYLATERLGSATVAVSRTVEGRLRAWGVAGDRIHVVPNGIDAARFRFDPRARAAVRAALGIPPGAFAVGGVGRLVAGKRFDVVVHAVAVIPGVVLLIAGDGPERPALEALAARLGAADRIRFLGECPDGSGGSGGADGSGGHGGPVRTDDPAGTDGSDGTDRCDRTDGTGGTGGSTGTGTGTDGGSGTGSPPPAVRPPAPPEDRPPAAGGTAAPGETPHTAPPSVPAPPVPVPTVPALLSAVDVFVSASREEAFGLAVVEALAAGLPVLHNACPAVEDLPRGRAPGARRIDGTADTLAAELRRELAAGARRLEPPPAVRHYDIAHSGERLMEIYGRVVAAAGRPPARRAPLPPSRPTAPAPSAPPQAPSARAARPPRSPRSARPPAAPSAPATPAAPPSTPPTPSSKRAPT